MHPRRPILITGCQRSGTTLLHLIMDSHPSIKGIDESIFECADMPIYLMSPSRATAVCFKLPRYAPLQSFMQVHQDMKVIWSIRNPLDVVASMMKLQMKLNDDISVPWSVHPLCGQKEIINCFYALTNDLREALRPWMKQFGIYTGVPPEHRSRECMVLWAALCWRIKNELPATYAGLRQRHHVLKYEDLVSEPEVVLRELMEYLETDWHDDLLHHHEMHDGVSIGATASNRAIDRRSIGSSTESLSAEEKALVKEICSRTAAGYGYTI